MSEEFWAGIKYWTFELHPDVPHAGRFACHVWCDKKRSTSSPTSRGRSMIVATVYGETLDDAVAMAKLIAECMNTEDKMNT